MPASRLYALSGTTSPDDRKSSAIAGSSTVNSAIPLTPSFTLRQSSSASRAPGTTQPIATIATGIGPLGASLVDGATSSGDGAGATDAAPRRAPIRATPSATLAPGGTDASATLGASGTFLRTIRLS